MLTDLHWQPEALGTLLLLVGYAAPLLTFDFLHWRAGSDTFVLQWPAWARALTYTVLLQLVLVWGRSGALDFVYFQF